MPDYEHVSRCPFCRKEHTVSSQLTGDDRGQPEPGNVMLCIRCGEFSVFDPAAAGTLRKPTHEERLEIELDEGVAATRQAWQEMVKLTGGVQ